jgi:Zn ribbon nucleic-acid-binding protein
LFGNLLLGDKDDDMESFQEDLRWLDAHPDLNIDFVRTLVLPGSPLYQYALENGHIQDEIAYLEKGYYTINVTRMSDDDYNKCLDLMDQAVLRREYPAKDISIDRLFKEKRKVHVSCKCPACDEKLHLAVCDFFGLENCQCGKCGQHFKVNLFNIFGDTIKNALQDVLRNKKIIIWGMGTVGKKMAMYCEPVLNENIHLIDRNPLIQGKKYGGKQVAAPESINFDAAYLLFGTSLMGKSGEAIPNTTVIETIKNDAQSLPVRIGAMMEVNSFVFDTVVESGYCRSQ